MRKKINSQTDEFKIWVLEENGIITGWQSLSPTSNNPAIRISIAESSTYIHPAHRGKNIGRTLMQHALKEAERTNLQMVIGFVAAKNLSMLEICDSLGWKRVGLIPKGAKPPFDQEVFFVAYSVSKKDVITK